MDKYYRALVKNAQGEKITVLVIKDSGLYQSIYIGKKCFHLGKKTKNLCIAIELAQAFAVQYTIIKENIYNIQTKCTTTNSNSETLPTLAMVNNIYNDGTYELIDLSANKSLHHCDVLPLHYRYRKSLKIMEYVYVFKEKFEIVGRA